MKTFDAYRIHTGKDKVSAVIWFDGERIKCTKKHIIDYVREQAGAKAEDDKMTWGSVPDFFRSGYKYLEPTKVDNTGKEV